MSKQLIVIGNVPSLAGLSVYLADQATTEIYLLADEEGVPGIVEDEEAQVVLPGAMVGTLTGKVKTVPGVNSYFVELTRNGQFVYIGVPFSGNKKWVVEKPSVIRSDLIPYAIGGVALLGIALIVWFQKRRNRKPSKLAMQ